MLYICLFIMSVGMMHLLNCILISTWAWTRCSRCSRRMGEVHQKPRNYSTVYQWLPSLKCHLQIKTKMSKITLKNSSCVTVDKFQFNRHSFSAQVVPTPAQSIPVQQRLQLLFLTICASFWHNLPAWLSGLQWAADCKGRKRKLKALIIKRKQTRR